MKLILPKDNEAWVDANQERYVNRLECWNRGFHSVVAFNSKGIAPVYHWGICETCQSMYSMEKVDPDEVNPYSTNASASVDE